MLTVVGGLGRRAGTPNRSGLNETPSASLIVARSGPESPVGTLASPGDGGEHADTGPGSDNILLTLEHGILSLRPTLDTGNDTITPLVVTAASTPQADQEWLDDPLRFLVGKFGRPHVLHPSDFTNGGDVSMFTSPQLNTRNSPLRRASTAALAQATAATTAAATDAVTPGGVDGVIGFGVGVSECKDDGDASSSESALLPGAVSSSHGARRAVAPPLPPLHTTAGRGSDVTDAIPVEPAPFQVPDLTAMSLLHYLFAICMYSRMYITRQGRLVGVVFKGDFLDEKWLAAAALEGGDADGDGSTSL